MKHIHLIFSLTIFCAFLTMTSCRCKIETDATQLAQIQIQRKAKILRMLKSADTVEMQQCRRQVLILDAEFNQLKQTFDKKYADSAAKAQFEKAYIKAMKNTN